MAFAPDELTCMNIDAVLVKERLMKFLPPVDKQYVKAPFNEKAKYWSKKKWENNILR